MPTCLESRLETDYRLWIEEQGGFCWKLWPMSRVGIPDRLVLLPRAVVIFVEFKRKGKKPRKIQHLVHNKIKELGFDVLVLDSHIQAAQQTNSILVKKGLPRASIPERWYRLDR